MAEATIIHFKEFEENRLDAFGEKVRLLVANVVYGLDVEEVEPSTVTVVSLTAGPGSYTSASSGTEVKVDLAEEIWPKDVEGCMLDVDEAIARARVISRAVKLCLAGGVNGEEGAVVNVWARQFAATGWQDANSET